MDTDTIWIETHKAIDDFFRILTCKKCQQQLKNPQQFLNCGHYACRKCIGIKTECVQCKIPGEVSDIYSDTAMNDLLLNLNVIAKTVGLTNSTNNLSETKTIKYSQNGDKINTKEQTVNKISKSLNETLYTSKCESVTSKSTSKGRIKETNLKNINKKNFKGETTLHIACRSNNVDRVQNLLEAGANPNTKDNAGWTPLQEAASYGFYEVCELLLKAGALPDLHGYDNRTALHEAVMIDNSNIVSLLINFNANNKVYDNVGKKPKDYCKSKIMSNLFKNLQNFEESNSDISESNKTLDLDKSLNCTSNESKIVLYGSNLKQKNRKLLFKLCTEKKLKIVNNLSHSVSHVIIDVDSSGSINLSFDVLLTILYGKWLINSDCLPILMDSENITTEDLNLFEVNPPQVDDGFIRSRENLERQNPKLFNNCYFYFAIKNFNYIQYDGMSITKEDLMKLVSAGDGTILTREPKPEDIQGVLSPFYVAHNSKHSLHKCTHYIIYIPDNSTSNLNSNRIIFNMKVLKTLPLKWFIESILKYKLIDPVDLGIILK